MPEEKTEETMASSTDEATQCFVEASQAFGIALSKMAEGITLWFRNVALPPFSELGEKLKELNEALDPILKEMREKEKLMDKGKAYGVSSRVISLCEHRKERVRKKNLNRLRKEVKRYERSIGKAGGQGTPEPADGYTGDRQPDEPVSGEVGVTESNG